MNFVSFFLIIKVNILIIQILIFFFLLLTFVGGDVSVELFLICNELKQGAVIPPEVINIFLKQIKHRILNNIPNSYSLKFVFTKVSLDKLIAISLSANKIKTTQSESAPLQLLSTNHMIILEG